MICTIHRRPLRNVLPHLLHDSSERTQPSKRNLADRIRLKRYDRGDESDNGKNSVLLYRVVNVVIVPQACAEQFYCEMIYSQSGKLEPTEDVSVIHRC
jgi:hypothetical protein